MSAQYATCDRPAAIANCAKTLSDRRRIVALTTVDPSDHAAIAADVAAAACCQAVVVDGATVLSDDAADDAVRLVRRAALDGHLAVVTNANRAEARTLWSYACASQLANGRLLVIGDGLMYRLSADDSVFKIIHHAGALFDAATRK